MPTETQTSTIRRFPDSVYAEQRKLTKRVLTAGFHGILQSCKQAEVLGILDASGNLLPQALPADMQPGADRDFGG